MPSDEEKTSEKTMEFKGEEQATTGSTPHEMSAEEKAARQKAIDLAFKKEKKHPLGIAWWLGIIVLILISISFVLAPAIEAVVARRSGSLEFGKYKGEAIKFENGNYFYEQYQNYGQQYRGSSSNPEQAAYAIWSNAYYSTVYYTALSQMARKAGIIAADSVVNRTIINSGYYDKDGKFDVATYNAASSDQKKSIETSVRRNLPAQTVMGDLTSILSSSGEQDFIASMADDSRSFEYVDFDLTAYPDDQAAAYATQNAQKFETLGISLMTAADQDAAQALADRVVGGEEFATVASSSSTDGFASQGGKVGDNVYFFQIQNTFKNAAEADQALAARASQMLGPFEGNNGWFILRVDSAAVPADFTNAQTLNAVKAYMSVYEAQMMDDYLKDQATQFAGTATEKGFDAAATDAGLSTVQVGATPMNIGNSTYLGSFQSTDPKQLLSYADSETVKSLYAADEDAVTGPVQAGSSYLVVKSGAKGEAGMGQYVKQFYNYLASNTMQGDVQYSVMHNDGFEDNFLTVFFKEIIGTPASN